MFWTKRESILRKHDYVAALVANSDLQHATRELVSGLKIVLPDDSPGAVVICSSHSGEGKTTIAVSLAFTMARIGLKVVLVDGDFYKPRIDEIFEIDKSPGFAELLYGESGISAVCHAVELPFDKERDVAQLDVIPCGNTRNRTINQMRRSQIKSGVSALTSQYDFVLIDAAPVLEASDALHLAPATDGVLFVVDAGNVFEDEAVRAKQRIEAAGGKLLGTVMNRYVEEEPAAGNYAYFAGKDG